MFPRAWRSAIPGQNEGATVRQSVAVFGLLALILATTGLYGTVAFTVSKRTREMGIRLSLGADASGVVRMVLRGAMGLVFTGGILGIILSAGLGQVVAGFLFGTSGMDPLTFIFVPALLSWRSRTRNFLSSLMPKLGSLTSALISPDPSLSWALPVKSVTISSSAPQC